ncbi:MAG: AbrB/MazE/SpoVT family DNA-binding domain-containing protein [Thermoproteota archaeon]
MEQKEVHEVVKVSERGQITIPRSIREIEDIRKGELLEVVYQDGMIVLTKLDKRGDLELALKLLGQGLTTAGYQKKEDILQFSKEIGKKVNREWPRED